MDRVVFEVGRVEYAITRPGPGIVAQGQRLHDVVLKKAVSAGVPKEKRLPQRLREKGVWDDTRQDEADRLLAEIATCNDDQELRQLRMRHLDLVRGLLKEQCATAEAQARNAQFHYFVSRCLVRSDTGLPVYRDLDDYLKHAADPVAYEGASRLFALLTGRQAWPEMSAVSLE